MHGDKNEIDDFFMHEPDSWIENFLVSLCNDVVALKPGSDENSRYWLEYWKGDSGIIVQKNSPEKPWTVYFIEKDIIRTFGYSYSFKSILKVLDVCGLTVKIIQSHEKSKKKTRKTRIIRRFNMDGK